MQRIFWFATTAALGLGTACGSLETDTDTQSGGLIEISRDDGTQLTGQFALKDTTLAFSALYDGERTDVSVTTGELVLTYGGDAMTGQYVVDGGGAVLDDATKKALAGLADALNRDIPDADVASPHRVLAGITAYWSEAPAGYAHEARGLDLAKDSYNSTSNDGISCVKKARGAYTQYSKGSGAVVSKWHVAGEHWGSNASGGDYSCMGRCGAGCTGNSVFGRWTLDCMEHDVCSYEQNASGGGSDYNCGDEYNEAIDDFTQPGWYGCDGGGGHVGNWWVNDPWFQGGCGHLPAGQGLAPGKSLWSCDGRFQLVMQGDGNLVLYQKNVGHLWNAGSMGARSFHMQGDGNAVVYSQRGTVLWASGTGGSHGASLYVQNDGNIVIVRTNGSVAWHAGTGGR